MRMNLKDGLSQLAIAQQEIVGSQFGNDGFVRAADGDGDGPGSLHHNAFQDGLTAYRSPFDSTILFVFCHNSSKKSKMQ